MKLFITLNEELGAHCIYLHTKTFYNLSMQIQKHKTATLHFGGLQKKIFIAIDNSLDLGSLLVPTQLTDQITIPKLPFDVYVREQHIYIGPVIGFLTWKKYYNDPNYLLMRFAKYDDIRGLIYIFRTDQVDKATQTISGSYYCPDSKKFIASTFPYPSAIYSRIALDSSIYTHFNNSIGSTIFNHPFNINKDQFHSILSAAPETACHLPETMKYTIPSVLHTMLNHYGRVYLKPTNSSRGRGLIHIRKTTKGYVVKDEIGNRHPLTSSKSLERVLQNKLKRCKNRFPLYLIQQDIPVQFDNRKVDFRAYFQKNNKKEWNYSGSEAKIAKKGSIVSNSSNRERMVIGEEALRTFYSMSDTNANDILSELTSLCKNAFSLIEKHNYHLGDVAVDFIIDHNHKIWLLELQLNYAAEKKSLRGKDEQQLLPTILPAPFYYAKALAGFTRFQ